MVDVGDSIKRRIITASKHDIQVHYKNARKLALKNQDTKAIKTKPLRIKLAAFGA